MIHDLYTESMGFELQKICPKMVSNWAVDELEEPPGRTGRVIPISSPCFNVWIHYLWKEMRKLIYNGDRC